MAGRTDNELLAQLVSDVGDIKGQVATAVEKSEANNRKLDTLGRALTKRLDHHSRRLGALEKAANTGRGALKALLWIGGGLVTLAGLVAAWAKVVGHAAAAAFGKGGG